MSLLFKRSLGGEVIGARRGRAGDYFSSRRKGGRYLCAIAAEILGPLCAILSCTCMIVQSNVVRSFKSDDHRPSSHGSVTAT